MTEDLMFIEESTFTDEKVEDYHIVVNKLLKFLIDEKKNVINKNIPLLDLIYDFCLKNGLSINFVGDAIQNDFYLKKLVEEDCIYHKIIKDTESKGETENVESW